MAKVREEMVKVGWSAPRRIKEAADACARTTGMSLNQFITQAVAQRVRRWEDPISGKPVLAQEKERLETAPYEGWVCSHGGHGGDVVPAAACVKMGAPDHHRRSWFWHDDFNRVWKEE